MRNPLRLMVSVTLLAAQATTSFPGLVAASSASVTPGVDPSKLEVSINTNTPNPIVIVGPQRPDFSTDVVAPLKAAEEQAAAQAAAEAAARAAAAQAARARAARVQTASVVVNTGDVWNALRMCEAGGNYARNSGNGYYGAYQFDIGTWNNFGGYSRADLAPPAVQDEKARDTQARRGWAPWPACARKLGLM